MRSQPVSCTFYLQTCLDNEMWSDMPEMIDPELSGLCPSIRSWQYPYRLFDEEPLRVWHPSVRGALYIYITIAFRT